MDQIPFTAINGNIVVEPIETEEVTATGMHIAHSKGERTESVALKGKVIEIAEDLERLKSVEIIRGMTSDFYKECTEDQEKFIKIKKKKVELGQTVVIAKWEAQIVLLEGKTYYVVKEKDILLILND